MNEFIKMELYIKVSGYSKNEDGTFQIQNIHLNNDKLVKNTVKIHRNLTEEQIKSLLGKTVKVINVKEYKQGYKVFYAGEDIKKVDSDIEFKVNKEIIIKVDNLQEKKEDTILQSIVNNGTRTDLFNIKIKGISKNLLNELQGKRVLIKGVRVSKTDFGTFYSSDKKPQIIG